MKEALILGGCLGIIISALGMIIFGFLSFLFHKKGYEENKMSIEKRETLLKKSRLYIIIIEILIVITGFFLIIIKASLEIYVFVFAVGIALLVWLLETHYGYLKLKKEMDIINKKIIEKQTDINR